MDWELTSRLLVITLYAAAYGVALTAHIKTGSRARRWSTTAIMAISAVWIGFYVWLLATDTHAVSNAGYVSRIFHYATAVGLAFMAGQIWSSDKALRRVMREID